ncbi:MAG: gamma-glutamyltranspeptidase / glutathione hydrolase [Streptosporangiaceae bacterium]|nr:gamma-glutamyltranspeptidase / glutathione hydrolase [Streptosporangiaceae bacterium]
MFTSRPELTGDVHMVASIQWLASAVGTSLLESGDNALDVALTAGFVLQIAGAIERRGAGSGSRRP